MAGDIFIIWKEFSNTGVTLGDSMNFYFIALLDEPEVQRAFIVNLIFGLVFATLGVWSLFRDLIRKPNNINNNIVFPGTVNQNPVINANIPTQVSAPVAVPEPENQQNEVSPE